MLACIIPSMFMSLGSLLPRLIEEEASTLVSLTVATEMSCVQVHDVWLSLI